MERNFVDDIQESIERALAEDIGAGDVTTLATIAEDAILSGRVIAKAPGMIAGLTVAEMTWQHLDPRTIFVRRVMDGTMVKAGQLVAQVQGPGRVLLTGERVALNFLQRMSGIATLTRRFVEAVKDTKAVILDTRKTAPGLRAIDKWAVRIGGGQNHRQGLYDMVLLKENHIAPAGGVTAAVQKVRAYLGDRPVPIEVEVTNLDELREALALSVDRIMLDNMSLTAMEQAVRIVNKAVPLEASGGVNLETVAAIAATGVDYISIGALTHSVTALDISLEIDQVSSTS